MEYAFRNDETSTLTQVELKEVQLIVRKGDTVHTIPYSAISHVCLQRKRNSYFLKIRSTDFGSVKVCYQSSGQEDDKTQSRQYNTFIRALHFQLIKNHCPVEYCTGLKPSNLVEKSCLVFSLGVLSYFIDDYFHLNPFHPLIFAFLIICLGGILTVWPYFLNNPKNYQPTDIPLNMLPPAH